MQPTEASKATLTVHPVTPELEGAVLAITVHPDHLAFVAEVWQMLAAAQADPHSVPYAILDGETVVGFYRLDFNPLAVAEREFPAPSVGLRGYVIDAGQQGRGYGTAAFGPIVRDIRERYPDVRSLNLSVNCRNAPAIRAYLKAGFVESGELYHGGPSGPQHVMTYLL